MKTKTKLILVIVLGIVVLGIASLFINTKKGSATVTPQGAFAQCLSNSGAKFYGAFWCPHCQKQKQMFGRSGSKLLPYIECSTKDGKEQTQICIDENIVGYPTWEFADGTRVSGEQTFSELALKTGCIVPN